MEENSSGAVSLEGASNPQGVNPAHYGNVDPETIQEIISLSVGNYVVVEFLVGTQNIVRKEGVLTAVGVSWLVLYDESTGTSVVCDMYSVKFVTYFDPGVRPTRTDNLQSAQRQMNGSGSRGRSGRNGYL
jgi:hypothetical protein